MWVQFPKTYKNYKINGLNKKKLTSLRLNPHKWSQDTNNKHNVLKTDKDHKYKKNLLRRGKPQLKEEYLCTQQGVRTDNH